MTRPKTSFGKRNRELDKQAKNRAKQEDRAARRERRGEATPAEDGPPVDQTAVLEEFARLHEELSDGRISLEDFELRQEELRSKLRVD